MNDCARFEAMIRDHSAGDLDPAAREPLLQHARLCAACRRLLELDADLGRLVARLPEPREAEWDRVHERVLREIAGRPASASLPALAWLAAAAALAVVAFVGGAFADRALTPPRSARPEARSGLLAALGAEAASNRAFSQVENARFTYSNVSFRKIGTDRVALAFDVSTHLEVVEQESSDLVREVLAQSLLNPSSTAARLKALDLAGGALDPKLRDALIFALAKDPSLAVRSEALALLSGRADEPAVQDALLVALRDDEAVQIRLQALESLAARRVDPGRLRDAIGSRPGGEALRVRLASFEQEL